MTEPTSDTQTAAPAPQAWANVFTRLNSVEQTYELVADVNGVPVVFATVKAGAVESATTQAQATQAEA